MGLMLPFILSLSAPRQATETPDPEPDPTDLVLGDSVVTMTGAQTLVGALAGTQNLYTPKMIYHDGKTYFSYHGIYQSEGQGQGYLIVYDGNSLLKPFRVTSVQTVSDSHTIPSLHVDDDGNLFMFQEREHDTPIDIYKGADFNNFTFLAEKIGTELSYCNLLKDEAGNGILWSRGQKLSGSVGYNMHVTKASNGFETWGTPVRISTTPDPAAVPTGIGSRHYPSVPLYRQLVGDWWYLMFSQRNDAGPDWEKYYAMKTHKTNNPFIVFENLAGTFSHNTGSSNYLTQAILDANFLIYDAGANTDNAYIPVATVSTHPKFFLVTGDANTGDLLLHIVDIPTGVLTTKTLNITGYTVYDAATTQSHAVKHMAYIEDGEYLEMAVEIDYPSSVIKTHLFRSYNLGETFHDQGDMFPEIATTTYRVTFPMNYHEIPNDTNFIITAHAVDGTTTNTQTTYIKRAAKGTIQTETPSIVVPAVSLSDANNFFDYVAIDGQISRSGNNVTGLTDQFGLRNATGSNNPQWNGSDEITLNGTNHSFSIATTGFSGLTKCTFFAVVRRTSTGNSRFFNISDNTQAFPNYIGFNIATTASSSAPSWTRKGLTANPEGSAELNESAQHIMANGELALIAWVVDGRCKVDIYVNGAKQYYQSNGYSTNAQYLTRGTMNFGTINSVKIGMLDTPTDFFYPFGFKRLTMKNTVYDFETFRALEKKIADTHGITLNYGYA